MQMKKFNAIQNTLQNPIQKKIWIDIMGKVSLETRGHSKNTWIPKIPRIQNTKLAKQNHSSATRNYENAIKEGVRETRNEFRSNAPIYYSTPPSYRTINLKLHTRKFQISLSKSKYKIIKSRYDIALHPLLRKLFLRHCSRFSNKMNICLRLVEQLKISWSKLP